MRTILDEQFAPITSSPGFLLASIDTVADHLVSWWESLGRKVTREDLGNTFPLALHRLEPITAGGAPREMLVELGPWTAYFDCFLGGTDPLSVVAVLSKRLGTRGVTINSTPDDSTPARTMRLGAVKFEMFGPERRKFLNYIRTIAVINEGTRWIFSANGEVQPFEETERYTARRIRDRFTSDMLERYCSALGIDAFNPNAYGRAILIESDARTAPGTEPISLAQHQAELGIVPGRASELRG